MLIVFSFTLAETQRTEMSSSPFGSSSSVDDVSNDDCDNDADDTSYDSTDYDMVSYDLATSSFSTCPSATISLNCDRRLDLGGDLDDGSCGGGLLLGGANGGSSGGYTVLATIEEGGETDEDTEDTGNDNASIVSSISDDTAESISMVTTESHLVISPTETISETLTPLESTLESLISETTISTELLSDDPHLLISEDTSLSSESSLTLQDVLDRTESPTTCKSPENIPTSDMSQTTLLKVEEDCRLHEGLRNENDDTDQPSQDSGSWIFSVEGNTDSVIHIPSQQHQTGRTSKLCSLMMLIYKVTSPIFV